MEIGNQIKKYRNQLELSQDELALKIYVTRQSISNWENDKNYPDIKSLLLLSSLFNVSLDKLIKGDIEKMKAEVNKEHLVEFKRIGNILTLMYVVLIVSPVLLTHYLEGVGFVIWAIYAFITFIVALRVEQHKKKNNVQTYKEIQAFLDGKVLEEDEKLVEKGKRNYQKLFMAVGSACVTVIVFKFITYIVELF